ncbi:MAG: cupredoxin domain-containing protein [Actinomycetota bacterium]|nr:cupredoxin domain-containing protein [Actinomycetota bacterium]
MSTTDDDTEQVDASRFGRRRLLLSTGAAAIGAALFAACGGDDETAPTGAGTNAPRATDGPGTTGAPVATGAPATTAAPGGSPGDTGASQPQAGSAEPVAITIMGFAFEPAEISVPVGTEITWTNEDSARHSVISDDGGGPFESEEFENGESYTAVVEEEGTFPYVCGVHPDMSATVTVTP